LGDHPAPLYNADGEVTEGLSQAQLREGIIFDSITSVGQVSVASDTPGFLSTLRAWKDMVDSHYTQSADRGGLDIMSAFPDTLSGDVTYSFRKVTNAIGVSPRVYHRSKRPKIKIRRSYPVGSDWWSIVDSDAPDIGSSWEAKSLGPKGHNQHYIQSSVAYSRDPIGHYVQHIKKVVRPLTEHSRFFLTGKGYMGLGAL
jgi:hypothetical protein